MDIVKIAGKTRTLAMYGEDIGVRKGDKKRGKKRGRCPFRTIALRAPSFETAVARPLRTETFARMRMKDRLPWW
jgi:hypothetical protein